MEGDSLIAMTPPVSDTAQNLAIAIEFFNQSTPLDTGFTFDYRPNPTVTEMEPQNHLIEYVRVNVTLSLSSCSTWPRIRRFSDASRWLLKFFTSFANYSRCLRLVLVSVFLNHVWTQVSLRMGGENVFTASCMREISNDYFMTYLYAPISTTVSGVL